MIDTEYLTTRQVAKMLGVCRQRVIFYCKAKRLGRKIGRDYAVTRAEVKAFAKSGRRPVGRPNAGQ